MIFFGSDPGSGSDFSESFGSDPDPKWFIPDPNPDQAKSSGSDRIRFHNTAYGHGSTFSVAPWSVFRNWIWLEGPDPNPLSEYRVFFSLKHPRDRGGGLWILKIYDHIRVLRLKLNWIRMRPILVPGNFAKIYCWPTDNSFFICFEKIYDQLLSCSRCKKTRNLHIYKIL